MSFPTLLQKDKVVDEKGVPVESSFRRSVDYVIGNILTKPIKKFNDLVWLLLSETGSGKSTVFTAELFKRVNDDNIVVTQPRIFNAMSIPFDIAKYNKGLTVGKNLGFSTSRKKVSIKRGMTFVTVDTLLYELKLKGDDVIKKYSYIIIDEVHVRNIGLDILLFKLKGLLKKYYPAAPKLILMSATFDVVKFSKYFGTDNIIRIKGKSYPIETNYLSKTVVDPVQENINKVIEIHESNIKELGEPLVDILVFIEGLKSGKDMIKLIDKYNETAKNKLMSVLITSDTMSKEEKKLKLKTKQRRIIFGTNAVETGVTIDSLKYVVEPGWHQSAEYYPNIDIYTLIKKPVTKTMSIQRIGRAGRLGPGVAYKMYTKETYDKMLTNSFPDILTDNTDDLILYILIDRLNLKFTQISELKDMKGDMNLSNLDMLDPPSSESISRSLESLYVLGYIDENNVPTKTGIILDKIGRLDIKSKKMVWSGLAWGVNLKDLIIIGAMLSNHKIIGNHRLFDKYNILNDFNMGNKFHYLVLDDFIDLLILYHSFENVLRKGNMKKWLEDSGVSYDAMIGIISIVQNTISTFKSLGVNCELGKSFKDNVEIFNNGNVEEFFEYIKKIKLCIYEGYKGNIAYFDGVYRSKTNGKKLDIRVKNNPKYILYDNILLREMNKFLKVSVSYTSVMSGFINVDEDFASI